MSINRKRSIFVGFLVLQILVVFYYGNRFASRLNHIPRTVSAAAPALPDDDDTVRLGGERIRAFDSQIEVHPDSFMTVTETIRVKAEGESIRRGIYRDFPTSYKDRWGNRYKVGFVVNEVRRDGRPEPYHLKPRPNGQRVYIGDKDVFLSPGEYTYTLTYTTSRQLGFFADHDELYWNVTGNGWAFPIDQVTAAVSLPEGAAAEVTFQTAFTGFQGADGRDYTMEVDAAGRPVFSTTRVLSPGEGLTISVGWPKGFVTEPGWLDNILLLILDNPGFLKLFLGLLLIVLYYMGVWYFCGRDPLKGAIFPRFHPPENFSPSQVRYLRRMGFDDKVTAAAMINLAVRGAVEIHQTQTQKFFGIGGQDQYDLTNTGRRVDLAPEEVALMTPLFTGASKFELKQANHKVLREGISALRQSLQRTVEKKYFFSNSGYSFLGFFLIVLFVIFGFHLAVEQGQIGFFPFAIMTLALFVVGTVFQFLLKAPTPRGREVMDHIEGFRLFLSVSEKDRLNYANPPERTPELFERYLPYALALDVEQEWSQQFTEVLAAAKTEAGTAYHPAWYAAGAGRPFSPQGMAAGLGTAMVASIAAASTPPGSSSGGGGGGFSGGGGGGGGGGGW